MSNDNKAVAVRAVAEVPFSQIERMAVAVAKSGMFAVKTPEGALSLMLIAQAEGIHPAQAMQDYDLIQNKPSLKSAAMLARFQRSGGKVRWIRSDDEVAEAEFSHPAGGSLTVKWDQARLSKAGLAGKEMHNKFPAQMKRARCISEGVRAIAPQCIPLNMYSVEETRDMEPDPAVIEGRAEVIQQAEKVAEHIAGFLTPEQRTLHVEAIKSAPDAVALRAVFSAAWEAARQAKDREAGTEFQAVYNTAKAAFEVVE